MYLLKKVGTFMNKQEILRGVGTHDGTFHADEVTACALLILFDCVDRDKIIRTRDRLVLESCEYVCDVGLEYNPEKKLFDHHQAEYQGSLSSAGMILLYLHEKGKITKKDYDFFNHNLVMGVDAHDNGKDPQILGLCSYSNIISSFMPIAYDESPNVLERAFFDALDFAVGYLTRMWERYQYSFSCRQIVEQAMKSNRECLMFEKNIPWLESFFELGGLDHSALYLIMPSGNHWKLRCIPPSYQDRMKVRVPLPDHWAGLLEDDLKKITGIPGAIFCHKGRFISVWETKEDALKALDTVLSKNSSNRYIPCEV